VSFSYLFFEVIYKPIPAPTTDINTFCCLEKISAFRRRRENYLDTVEAINSHYSSDAVKRDKKITDLRNKEIKEIVFEEFLRICENMKKRNQNITKFFTPVKK
jgi:hypothetical protein